MDIDLSTDTAPSPERTIQLAETIAESVRVLNHQTRHHEALRYPPEADRLIRELSSAASRLPQLLEQIAGWLEAEQAAGRIEIADGSSYTTPALAADVARLQLEQAQAQARMLQHALDAAAAVTCDMSGVEDGSDE
jgi:hypothetical protein